MQEILGGKYVAVEKYSAPFFQRFRSGNIVELTIDFARVGLLFCFVRCLACCRYSCIFVYLFIKALFASCT